MTIKKIEIHLKTLEIHSKSQLESKDIDHWWQIKFKKIQSNKNIEDKEKQSILVSINNARDELNELEISIIKKLLEENSQDYSSTKQNDNQKQNSRRRNKPENNFNFSKEYIFTPKGTLRFSAWLSIFFFGLGAIVLIEETIMQIGCLLFVLLGISSLFSKIKISKKGIYYTIFFYTQYYEWEKIKDAKAIGEEVGDIKAIKLFFKRKVNGRLSSTFSNLSNDTNEIVNTISAFLNYF